MQRQVVTIADSVYSWSCFTTPSGQGPIRYHASVPSGPGTNRLLWLWVFLFWLFHASVWLLSLKAHPHHFVFYSSFHGWFIFRCMDIIQFDYPSTIWWAFRLSLPFLSIWLMLLVFVDMLFALFSVSRLFSRRRINEYIAVWCLAFWGNWR